MSCFSSPSRVLSLVYHAGIGAALVAQCQWLRCMVAAWLLLASPYTGSPALSQQCRRSSDPSPTSTTAIARAKRQGFSLVHQLCCLSRISVLHFQVQLPALGAVVRRVRRRRVAHRLVPAGVHVAELIRHHLQVPCPEVAQAVVLVQDLVLAGDRMSFAALLPLAPHSVLCLGSVGISRASNTDDAPRLKVMSRKLASYVRLQGARESDACRLRPSTTVERQRLKCRVRLQRARESDLYSASTTQLASVAWSTKMCDSDSDSRSRLSISCAACTFSALFRVPPAAIVDGTSSGSAQLSLHTQSISTTGAKPPNGKGRGSTGPITMTRCPWCQNCPGHAR